MKILSRPRGNAEEYGRWSVNPYVGCPHGCSYCYLKKGVWAKELGGNVPRLKKGIIDENHAFHLAMVEILENKEQIIKDGGLFMSFVTDPCSPLTFSLFSRIASRSMDGGIPVTMLTKDAEFCGKDNPVIQTIDRVEHINDWLINIEMMQSTYKERLSIGFTLTGHDELEPNASPNAERIKAIEYLHNEGWHTWASIEPVIDFQSSYRMVCQALRAGCQHFKIGLLTSNTKPCREKYDAVECLRFIEEVMRTVEDKATVYWKQSVRNFIHTCRKPILSDNELYNIFDSWKHSVSKDWSMFNIKK